MVVVRPRRVGSRRVSLGALAVCLSAVLLVPAAALACTPLPRSFVVVPQAASARDGATVVGQGLSPGTPVDVVWNDAEGAALGTATADQSGRFSLPVAVPESTPGAHAIVFVARSPAGPSVVGRLPFSVTGAPGGGAETRPAWRSDVRSGVRTAGRTGDPRVLLGAGLSALAVAVLAGSTVLFVRRRRAAPTS